MLHIFTFTVGKALFANCCKDVDALETLFARASVLTYVL